MSRRKKGSKKMKDPGGEGEAIREAVKAAVDGCTDVSLLDLVYKILVGST